MPVNSDYERKEEVFKGLSCVMYRGVRKSDQRDILIKVPSKRFHREAGLARFRHEHEVTADLDLDIILHSLDVIEDEEPAMVYESFEGAPISMHLGRLRRDPKRVLEIAIQIVKAIHEIHGREIIHKNLNPETLFYHPDTGQLKVSSFEWATLISKEHPRIFSAHAVEGMLEYVSPEQTGRSARALDYRADYYAMGVMLYQMLTGELPFEAEDPIALIHAHCSRQPKPPRSVDRQISRDISDVVMKLLAKAPEDRYQSGPGLISDLTYCLNRMRGAQPRESFIPGADDVVRRFQIPQRFIGRDTERGVLTEALARAARGRFSFHLIGGDAGAGKMDMIREAQKDAIQSSGYVAMDGFNPLSHTAPYSGVQDAFRELMLQILGEDETRQEAWRREILEAVGKNGQLLAPLIPGITKLIGAQPAPLRLPQEEEIQRLETVFINFIGAVARRARPLILILAELQWADSASLRLLSALIKHHEIPFFAFVGSCQVSKIAPKHPLEPILEKLRENAVDFGYISVRSFNRRELTQFTATALNVDERSVAPLAQIVFEKTGGNPYFAGQFLRVLHQKNYLSFGEQREEWVWDREEINKLEITENMGDFLAERIAAMGDATKEVLQLASIIGEDFDLGTLAELYGDRPKNTAAALWEAVQQGVVVPMGDSYRIFIPSHTQTPAVSSSLEGSESFRFAHGKIQSAAYSMMDEETRLRHHSELGAILWDRDDHEAMLIDVVNHLNLGRSFITNPDRLHRVAELNLEAAQRARKAAAYHSAVEYAKAGMSILCDVGEEDPVYFRLEVLRAECEYLNTNFAEAERIINNITEKAPTGMDLARVYDLKVILCANRGRNLEGIDAGYHALRLLGLRFPRSEDQISAATKKELNRFDDRWGGKTIADLADLPEMTEADKLLAVKILTNLVPLWNQSFQTEGRRIMLLALRGINLSVEHGNSAHSAVCYSLYGMFSLEWHQHAKVGLELGKLGMKLAEQFGSGFAKCRTNNIFGAFINHWSSHARTSLDYLERGFRAGRDYGEPVYAVYALVHKLVIRTFIEPKLSQVYRDCQEYRDYVSRTGYREFQDFLLSYQWTLDQLMGHEDAFFEYDAFVSRLNSYQDKIPICVHYLNEAKAAYYLEDYQKSYRMIQRTGEHIGFLTGSLLVAEFIFYKAMSLIELYPKVGVDEQRQYLHKIEHCRRKLEFWSDHCPENFLHLKLMIEAEVMALHESHLQAMQLFDSAIEAAHAQGFVQFEALANELAGKFYLDKGRRKISTVYLTDAYISYQEWGAAAKCRQLEVRYRDHIRLELANLTASSQEPSEAPKYYLKSEDMELNDYFRPPSWLAATTETDRILEQLIENALEATHAQNAFLILNRGGRWIVKVEGWHDERGILVLKGTPVDDCRGLCPAIVHKVLQSGRSVLLANACKEGEFVGHQHIREHRCKSILCLANSAESPNLTLYLQNGLITGAFNESHLQRMMMMLKQTDTMLTSITD